MCNIFDACGGTDTSYAQLKKRMLRWFEKQEASGHQTAKQRFDSCKRRTTEALPLFALRLSSLFKDAYPATDMQTSRVLRDRLLDNLPPQAADQLKKKERYNKDIHGITLKWDNYVTILQCELFEDDASSSLLFSRERRSLSSFARSKSPQVRSQRQSSPVKSRTARRGSSRSSCPACHKDLSHQDDYSSSEFEYDHRAEGRDAARRKGQKQEKVPHQEGGSSNNRSQRRTLETCKFCHRRGHVERDCWRKKNFCLRCGQPGHYVRDSPSGPTGTDTSRRRRTSYRSREENPGGSPGRSRGTTPGRRLTNTTEQFRDQDSDSDDLTRNGRADLASHKHRQNQRHPSEN